MTTERPSTAVQTDKRAAQGPRIWVDADSFPVKARDLLLKVAASKGLPVIYVANHDIAFGIQSPLFEMLVCPPTPGAADDCIADGCTPGDIVATRDIPLAARLVEKGICVINDRGVRYDKRTVEKRLKERALSMQMEALGLHKGHSHESYGGKELEAFSKCLHSVLSSMGL